MISRRNYIVIMAVMAVVFFLFQFTNVMLEGWNDYETNEYACDTGALPGRSSACVVDEYGSEERDRIIYIGDGRGPESGVVRMWAEYAKKRMLSYETLEEFQTVWQDRGKPWPDMLVISGGRADAGEGTGYLETCAAAGVNVIFCSLPEVSVVKQDSGLRRLLGITDIRAEETTVKGLHLYEGFLLGGEALYDTEDQEERARRQDLELTFPWYGLSAGTDVYMRGITADRNIREADAPPVIWKNVYKGTDVFAVNGRYMEDVSGLGILSAMSAGSRHYELYPVVNAQNLVAVNLPGSSGENEAEVIQRYGQPTEKLLRDVVWPAVISVYRRNSLGLTCMLAPQLDYEDASGPDEDQLVYYMKRLKEEQAETGLSGFCVSDTSVGQKLLQDRTLMKRILPDYRFTSFYAGGLTPEEVDLALEKEFLQDVRTVAANYDGTGVVIGYQNEEVTRQSILTDIVRYTYGEDFRSRSIETALGYASVLTDFSRIVYPLEKQENAADPASFAGWNLKYDFAGFCGFAGTTLSESDARIRNFLTLDYTEHRKDDAVYLELKHMVSPVWFVLRCKGEAPGRVEGGSFRKLEQDVYLIEAEDKNVVIMLKEDKSRQSADRTEKGKG